VRGVVLRVFSFALAAKLMMALIRYLPQVEYARCTLAMAAASVAARALASTFNRTYIVGYERLAMAGASPAFLGLQLMVLVGAALQACRGTRCTPRSGWSCSWTARRWCWTTT
jgi:hypothetical protein